MYRKHHNLGEQRHITSEVQICVLAPAAQLFSFFRTVRLLLYLFIMSTILPLWSNNLCICDLASTIWSLMILER